MKILVSDSLSGEGLNILKDSGFDVVVDTGLSEDQLIEKIKDVDALVIRSGTQVTARVIEAADNLKIIGRAGVGVDNVDVDAATKKGIIVSNTPDGNTLSAAEHTCAMMMAVARNIPQACASLKSEKWERNKFMGVEFNKKVLGVIGLGRIGAEVAKRFQSFNMTVLGYDPFVSEERAKSMGITLATVEEICRKADFITVHTPLTKDTKNLINTAMFDVMKPTARIVNCARGGIINEEDLAAAVESGKIAGAAIDVFVEEPPFNSSGAGLLKSDKIIVTPHLGASTVEAQVNVAIDIAHEIINVLNGEGAKSAVNIPAVRPEVMEVISPYVKLAEVSGKIAATLIGTGYDKVELAYNGDISTKDVRTVTLAALKGALAVAVGAGVNYVNAPGLAKSRGIVVNENKSETSGEYASVFTMTVSGGGKSVSVSGTAIGNDIKIIQINQTRVDVFPSAHMIFADHINKPNVIGPCCQILGENNINISGMQVGHVAVGEPTIMVISVDSDVPEDVLSKLTTVDGVLSAKIVEI
ncbi:D-3-phosphoglycerate dehydrogenase [Methanimicrococcus sp. At1]|uniref:D-3-phosphoglycerate dehydrogenase n=1 Tax=Methanimicrococcus hacksteinii TaxID=3028293 RepID=A0ABU3VNU6_9EURY|nr:phosphoglycerate dehydrogenase [Methanimicrococcus sp. At1]MDV0445082.1 D-3-phosphoglycerate dehydrogenase [Methanimicrococcus sp. At1]